MGIVIDALRLINLFILLLIGDCFTFDVWNLHIVCRIDDCLGSLVTFEGCGKEEPKGND
jgi:hypothetical protein